MPKAKVKLIRAGANKNKARSSGYKNGSKRPKNAGRPPGRRNHLNALLRDLIALAADDLGVDNKGTDGLRGWLRRQAMVFPETYMQLIAKILPLQVNIATPPVKEKFGIEELRKRVRERGLPVPMLMSPAGATDDPSTAVPDPVYDEFTEELNGRGPHNEYAQDEDEPLDDVEYEHVEK